MSGAEALFVIGVVANAVQLIDFAGTIIERIQGFSQDAKNVPEAFRSLQTELPLLANTLKRTSEKARSGELDEETCKAIGPVVAMCEKNLRTLHEIFAKVVPKQGASKVEVVWKAIASTKKDSEIERIAAAIGSSVRTLTLYYAESAGLTKTERAVIMEAVSKLAVSEREKPTEAFFDVPFSLAGAPVTGAFVGRKEDIQLLEKRLRVADRRQICVLHGLGGLGKTQLAIEYARAHRQKYSSVFWLDGATEESLVQSIVRNAKRIPGMDADVQRTKFAESKDQALQILRWFSLEGNNRWLLIYDNVDKTSFRAGKNDSESLAAYDITDYLPDGDAGSVVITTRLSRLTVLGESLQLRKLNAEESLVMLEEVSKKRFRQEIGDFRKSRSREIDDFRKDRSEIDSNRKRSETDDPKKSQTSIPSEVSTLLNKLDGLPLALTLAGTHLQVMSITDYLELYDDCWESLHSEEIHDYPRRTIATTWLVSFKHIEAVDKPAATLLKIWGFLDNRDIWYELLGQKISKLSFFKTMKLLLDHSLIEQAESTSSYGIHSVVHEWIKSHWSDVQNFLGAVACVGRAVPDSDSPEHWNLKQRLLPHADRLMEKLKRDGTTMYPKETIVNLDIGAAFSSLGRLYTHQGRHSEAQYMYERAIDAFQVSGREKVPLFETMDGMGTVFAYQGRNAEAEMMWLKAIEGLEKLVGTEHRSTLQAICNLGLLYAGCGRLSEAERELLRVLKVKQRIAGPDDPSTLNAANNLGLLYVEQGRLDEAEKLYHEQVRSAGTLGPNHRSVLTITKDLGRLYKRQGRFNEAEKMYSRALEGFTQTLGPGHLETIESVSNMGELLSNQGRFPEAERIYSQMLHSLQKSYKPDNPAILAMYHRLGRLYSDQEKILEAKEMYLRTIEGRERALGADHRATLLSAYHLASLYEREGQDDLAKPLMIRAFGNANLRFYCDTCDKTIRDKSYHCDTCRNGDLDFCEICISGGGWCLESSHSLRERIFEDGMYRTRVITKPK
jgi:tetratricopeptide (TPR) repeat protein